MEETVEISKEKLKQLKKYFFKACEYCNTIIYVGDIVEFEWEAPEDLLEMKKWVEENIET